jgi:hypothetical protein
MEILQSALEIILTIVGIFLLWALLMALLSPLESLGWWAGWFGDKAEADEDELDRHGVQALPPGKHHFIIFLTGIGGVESEVHFPEERRFLDRLDARIPEAVIVDDIFPYSVTNRALTGNRIFSWFWRIALRKQSERKPLAKLINIRNIFQVLVSSDHRYGPMYDRGSAEIVIKGLLRHGYVIGSGVPVYIIGYSGGGQIAIGSAAYVSARIKAPVRILSLAGVFCADPSIPKIDHIYHIHGRIDGVERLGRRIFPGRWPIMRHSTWNQALADGRATITDMGDMIHNGPGSYLDPDSMVDETHSYLDKTVETMAIIVTGEGVELPPAKKDES